MHNRKLANLIKVICIDIQLIKNYIYIHTYVCECVDNIFIVQMETNVTLLQLVLVFVKSVIFFIFDREKGNEEPVTQF